MLRLRPPEKIALPSSDVELLINPNKAAKFVLEQAKIVTPNSHNLMHVDCCNDKKIATFKTNQSVSTGWIDTVPLTPKVMFASAQNKVLSL